MKIIMIRGYYFSALPYRQLRKVKALEAFPVSGALPYRQLRNL